MVDCLQVFSDAHSVPGHGGGLMRIRTCGGLTNSLYDSGKFKSEATLDLHLRVSIY